MLKWGNWGLRVGILVFTMVLNYLWLSFSPAVVSSWQRFSVGFWGFPWAQLGDYGNLWGKNPLGNVIVFFPRFNRQGHFLTLLTLSILYASYFHYSLRVINGFEFVMGCYVCLNSFKLLGWKPNARKYKETTNIMVVLSLLLVSWLKWQCMLISMSLVF